MEESVSIKIITCLLSFFKPIRYRKNCLILFITCVFTQSLFSQPGAPDKASFADPGSEYRALPLGYKKRDESITAYTDRLVNGRWGGAHASHPVGGQGYLRDIEGWNSYRDLVRESRDRGLRIWIYDEKGYPSGRAGQQVLEGHPEYEAQGLFYDSKDFQVRSNRNSDVTREIEWRIPDGTPYYVVRYALNRQGHIIGKASVLTDSVSDGTVRVSLPPGSWRIMAFVRNRLFEGTHASLTGGPYINILDPDAVRRFLSITHDAYFARFGENFGHTITAFFNDEVSLMTGFLTDDTQEYPAIAWYHGLPELFRNRTGYDIKNCLPALFDDVGTETVRMRCDFYSMLGQQIADAFFKQVREWCEEHHVASTGHLLWEESLIYHTNYYGTVFPSYKELDWPGIDELGCQYGCTSGAHTEGGPVTPKLASSAAHIWGKPRTMSESFCFVTNEIPIEEVIAHYNWQAVLGINTLTTITIQNSYTTEELGRFNDCVGRLNYMLTQGEFTADVAILYPIASVWAGFKPTTRHVHNLGDNPKARDVDDAWRQVSARVLSCQRDFDYIDEELVRSATITNGKLCIGNNNYSVLVLPHVTTLSFSTLNQIGLFVKNGGTVISWRTLPLNRADDGPAAEYRELVEELWNDQTDGVIHAMTETDFLKVVKSSGSPDLLVTPSTTEVYYQHRILPDGDIYFLMNNSREPLTRDFTCRARGRAELWDPVNGEITKVNPVVTPSGSTIRLALAPRSGIFIVFNQN